MSVYVDDIIKYMEKLAPPWLAEDWDNVGLLLGSVGKEVKKLMVSLDVTSAVVKEAVDKGVDMIITHHPLIFKSIKSLNPDEPKGRIIYEMIKKDICVYSAHTNLDTAEGGLNDFLACKLGLNSVKNLRKYVSEKLYKLAVFVPVESVEKVREAICRAGAGHIGQYSDCTFMVAGIGTYTPLEGTNPYKGLQGRLEKTDEYKLETIVPENRLIAVVNAMLKAHPYEEVAYDLYELRQEGKTYGMGKVGMLDKSLPPSEFLEKVKNVLGIKNLEVIGQVPQMIRKVAVLCGSFDGNYSGLLENNIDILITGDIKYHNAVDICEMGLCAVDAGHYGTERIVVELLVNYLSREFKSVEVTGSLMERNPFSLY